MSATNRGSKRKPYDFYATPPEVIENLLKHIDLNKYGNRILEPSAGNGNFCRVIKQYYPNKHITALEIRNEERNNLELYSDEVIINDYLKLDTNNKYNIIIGNPPYSKAIDFVNKSLQLLNRDSGVLIFLLRTAFLESKSRYKFWQDNPLTALYTLSKRPSFTGKGTDATSYSWFIWDNSTINQYIKVI